MALCPHCVAKYELPDDQVQVLREPQACNKLSRRDNRTYICHACGLAEVWADASRGSVTDRDARQRVQMRLAVLVKAGLLPASELGISTRKRTYFEETALRLRKRKATLL
jgi:hypothetical protein